MVGIDTKVSTDSGKKPGSSTELYGDKPTTPETPNTEAKSPEKTRTSAIEINGIGKRNFTITPENLLKLLPRQVIVNSEIKAQKLGGDGYLVECGEYVIFVASSGLVYLNDGPDRTSKFDAQAHLAPTGDLFAENNRKISPRARVISVGDGAIVAAPPNVELVNRTPNIFNTLFVKAKTALLGESSHDPVAAKAIVTMSQPWIITSNGPFGGPQDGGVNQVKVEFTIRSSGKLSISESLGGDHCLPPTFPWEDRLRCI
jgi:hypothetical protein